jgi:branched-chain amino acid transport system permease protein
MISVKGDMKTEKFKILVFSIVLVCLLILPAFAKGIVMFLAILGLIGGIAALGVNIFFGYCGQVNFGTAGFMAIGGYSVALLERDLHTPYFLNLVIGIVVSGLIALLVSVFLLRLRHFVLGLGTVAFGLAVYSVFAKGFTDYTRGEDGVSLNPLQLFGIQAGDNFFYYLSLICVILCIWISYAVRNSRVGRGMVAIAENEVAATSMGVDIDHHLRIALVLNGLLNGLAGGLLVKYLNFCSPDHFNLSYSILVFIGVVVGGAGSALGAALGGIIMFTINEILTPLGLYHTLTYGVILGSILLFMPDGIVGGIRSLAHRWSGASKK